mgnify:CR=1 FL=1
MRRLGLLLVLLLLPAAVGAHDPPALRPNIVLILTDDEDVRIHAFLPKTKALLEDRGAVFPNAFVPYPLCCPSRASLLRGQYPHNTGVLGNQPPLGGFDVFVQQGLEASTVATWLQSVGYRTVFAGKYLNGYGDGGSDPRHVPPGWTEWYAGLGGRPYGNYDYTLNENGRIVQYGHAAEDYLTDVIARKAVEAIERAVRAGQPFFLYLATYAPHAPAVPAPRHAHLFQDAPLPRPPSFNEADVSDKPTVIRRRPPLNPRSIARMEVLYRRRLQSLQAVDDLVETVVRTLARLGQLDRTYLVYTSDNGFHMGEHRLPPGKNLPYEEDIRVPLVVRGPGVRPGQRIDSLVVNTDLAPTFAEIAGITPPAFVDGRSLLPLLRGQSPRWRQSLLIQVRTPAGGGFEAIRTAEWKYVVWRTGELELYNLRADPYELENLAASAPPELVAGLSARLRELARCAAEGCRAAEEAP